MGRYALIAAVCALGLSAQYAEVVTSDDGRQIYFTTQLVLKDSGPAQRPELRLFRVDGQQVQLVADRGSLKPQWAFGNGDGV